MVTKYDQEDLDTVEVFEPIKMTTWVNTQDKVVSFKYLTTKQTGKKNSGVAFQQITLKPGQAVKIPSEYDDAIRDERLGVVVGGLAPFLLKKDESPEDVQMHDCLDYKRIAKELEVTNLASKLVKEDSLKRAVELSGQQDAEKAVVAAKKLGRQAKE